MGERRKDDIWGGVCGGQYGDVSTLKVRGKHFPSIRQPFCQVHRDRTEPVPASQLAHDEGHIYYMPCPHNTCSNPRWQALESALKKSQKLCRRRYKEMTRDVRATMSQDAKQCFSVSGAKTRRAHTHKCKNRMAGCNSRQIRSTF